MLIRYSINGGRPFTYVFRNGWVRVSEWAEGVSDLDSSRGRVTLVGLFIRGDTESGVS
jgi:hypothetical protein